MIITPQMVLPPAVSNLVDALREGRAESEMWFYAVFGRGVRFFAERYCPNQADACFEASMTASIEAIRRGAVPRDGDVPGLVRQELHRVVGRLVGHSCEPHETPSGTPCAFDGIAARLSIFTRHERNILNRFYLLGKDAERISEEMHIVKERVNFLRFAARMAIRPFVSNPSFRIERMRAAAATSSPSVRAV